MSSTLNLRLAGQLRFIKGCSSVGCGMKLCLGRGSSVGEWVMGYPLKTKMGMENHNYIGLTGDTFANGCFSTLMLVQVCIWKDFNTTVSTHGLITTAKLIQIGNDLNTHLEGFSLYQLQLYQLTVVFSFFPLLIKGQSTLPNCKPALGTFPSLFGKT